MYQSILLFKLIFEKKRQVTDILTLLYIRNKLVVTFVSCFVEYNYENLNRFEMQINIMSAKLFFVCIIFMIKNIR